MGDYNYNTDELNRAGYFETFVSPIDFQFFGNGKNVLVTAPTGSTEEHQLITVIDEDGNYSGGEPTECVTSVWRLDNYGMNFDEARFSGTSASDSVQKTGGLAAAVERFLLSDAESGLRYSLFSSGAMQLVDISAVAFGRQVAAPEPAGGDLALMALVVASISARFRVGERRADSPLRGR